MNPGTPDTEGVISLSKRLLKQALTIGYGRLELLSVELQEERERLMFALLLALGTAVFGLLAGIVLTLLLVVLTWNHSPALTLAVLLAIYSGACFATCRRLFRLRREAKLLPATMEQLHKDRQCLDQIIR